MSYRIYIEVEKNGEKIGSHQLFGNNEYPDSLYKYLIDKNLIDKKTLEENDYIISDEYKIEIKNLLEFNEVVIAPWIKENYKAKLYTNFIGRKCYEIPFEVKAIKEGNIFQIWMFLKHNIVLEFYNLCNYLNEKDCFKYGFLKSLELKENIKLYIEAF